MQKTASISQIIIEDIGDSYITQEEYNNIYIKYIIMMLRRNQ
jgi:hypothetical protein